MIKVDVALKKGSFRLNAAFEARKSLTALFGQSGAGKSLTLLLIAGLLRPDTGSILLGGEVLTDIARGIFIPPHRRRMGFVFQDSHLFPHLSVRQNLQFGRWFAPRRQGSITMGAVVETLGIKKLLARRPATLSGGERQRVAIGRALLSNPRLLLFDEPLAALDMERRVEILGLIERVRDEFAVPALYVSHAIEEVARLADEAVVLEDGQVKAIGSPEKVLAPHGHGSGGRFDRISVLAASVGGFNGSYSLTRLDHPAGAIWLAGQAGPVGKRVRILVRAADVVLSSRAPQGLSVRSVLRGRVGAIEDLGPFAAIEVMLIGEGKLCAIITRHALDELSLKSGEEVFALIKTSAIDERPISW